MRGRLVLALASDVRVPHGYTEGKLYRFRGDCGECLFEAWERMTYGGLGDVQGPGVYKTVDYMREPYVVNR